MTLSRVLVTDVLSCVSLDSTCEASSHKIPHTSGVFLLENDGMTCHELRSHYELTPSSLRDFSNSYPSR